MITITSVNLAKVVKFPLISIRFHLWIKNQGSIMTAHRVCVYQHLVSSVSYLMAHIVYVLSERSGYMRMCVLGIICVKMLGIGYTARCTTMRSTLV